MNRDILEGRWEQLKAEARSRWAELTEDDIAAVSAKKDSLLGRLQERYGMLKEDAETQVDLWLAGLDRRGSRSV
jgi:uncharacterized protein YjbJ (UPF0337 family)